MAFEAVARAIFRMEGSIDKDGNWITSSVGYRNNNPGNLIYAGQPGATPLRARDPNLPGAGDNITYARFATLEQGILATQRQLALDAGRGKTLGERIYSWAEKNKAAYVRNVSEWLGVDPSTRLSDLALGTAGNFPKARPLTPTPGPPQPKGKAVKTPPAPASGGGPSATGSSSSLK